MSLLFGYSVHKADNWLIVCTYLTQEKVNDVEDHIEGEFGGK